MPHTHSGRRSAHDHDGDGLIRWAGFYGLGMRLWGRGGRRWRSDLADRLGLRPGDRVLDVASGTGELAFALAGRVMPDGSVDGVDAAAEMVDHATARGRRLRLPVTFQVARAQQLPFDDDRFTAVTCTLAMHHIAANQRLLAVGEIRRVLQPGGRLLIADVQMPPGRLASVVTRHVFGHALAERPLDEAAVLLENAGFHALTRGSTTASWLGLISGTNPSRV